MAGIACTFILCVVFVIIPAISMSCSDGQFPDENRKCVPCPEHCLFCESSTKCLSCETGFWGTVCEKPCSTCRTDTSCEKTTGFCLVACRDGYSGVLCEDLCDSKCSSCNRTNKQDCLECSYGRYPPVLCNNFCSTCDKTTCDKSGICTYGCQSGYVGIKCDDKETNSLVLIIIVVAVALTIVMTTVVIFIWRRRANNASLADDGAPEAMEMMGKRTTQKASKKDVRKPKAGSRSSKQKKQKLNIQDKLYNLAKSIQTKTDDVYRTEWKNLQPETANLSKECRVKRPPGELEKQKTGPYEYNKVTVEYRAQPYYFNASYIVYFPLNGENLDAFYQLPREEKGRTTAYIACIGPTTEYKNCFALFWTMVWQENCQTIVMLNTIKKKGREQYWPSLHQRNKYNSEILVWCREEQHKKDYIIRSFNVKKRSEDRTVTQFQYLTWPEGERTVTKTLLEFYNTVQKETLTGGGPLIVHGRAGIGRTGTFIALDMLRKAAEAILDSMDKADEKLIDILACVEHLRKQRVNMIENFEQYKFLHEAFAQVTLNLLDEKGYQKKDE